MNRREALSRVAWIMGGTIIGTGFFLEGCSRKAIKGVAGLFEESSIDLLGNIAETILPKTATPGAKEAGVGSFIPVMIRDCYTPEDQKVFLDGLVKLDDASDAKYHKVFQDLTAEQRTELITAIDSEAKDYQKNKKEEEPNHYFRILKELTLLGFFTSELGATKALRYVFIPGKYDGNYPYKKGDRAWAL